MLHDTVDVTCLETASLEISFDFITVKYVIYGSFRTTSQETHPLEYVFLLAIDETHSDGNTELGSNHLYGRSD